MSTQTTNIQLVKPDPEELYDIGVHNSNYDKIDDNTGITICTSSTRPPSPRPRRAIFETDTNLGYVWDGSEWVQISTVSLVGLVLLSTINAKGDLLVGTAEDELTRLGVGANGAQLLADSAQATGLRWDNNPPMKVVTLPDQASIPIDPTAGKFFKLNATGNRTLQAPSVAADGREIIIAHTASGNARTLVLTQGSAGAFRIAGGASVLNSTAINQTDYLRAIYNSSVSRWDIAYMSEGHQ